MGYVILGSTALKCIIFFYPIEHVLNKNETTSENSNDLPKKEVLSLGINKDQLSQPQHDVPYFRCVLFLF